MIIEELKPGMLIQQNSTGLRTLYQVAAVYENAVTLQWVYSITKGDKSGFFPGRTKVYRFTEDELAKLSPASANLVNTWAQHYSEKLN